MMMKASAVDKEIIGVGWRFPVRVDRRGADEAAAPDAGRGGIALARHEFDIEEAIRIIISTAKGERRMRPTFGCDVHTLMFAPANATTFGLIRHHVEEALKIWEPRVEVRAVDVTYDNSDGRVDVLITYEVRSTKEERALVYPFYMIGGE